MWWTGDLPRVFPRELMLAEWVIQLLYFGYFQDKNSAILYAIENFFILKPHSGHSRKLKVVYSFSDEAMRKNWGSLKHD